MNRVYLIGIGGIGMSALARYYNHSGYVVAGYDRTPSKLTDSLIAEGISIHFQDSVSMIPDLFKPKDIDKKGEILVIYTPAVPSEMEELSYFREHKYNVIKRSEALGVIASAKQTLAVAGTHGKTTTTTLLSHILTDSGFGCTAFLGGISKNYKTNLILSKTDTLVAEADEFDRSFLQLFPKIAIVTSIDPDHLDIYQTSSSMVEAFSSFIGQIKEGGSLIIKQGIDLSKLNIPKGVTIYQYSSTVEAYFCISNIKVVKGGFYIFDLIYGDRSIKDCTLGIPGIINIENAVAASAAALLAGVAEEKIKRALSSFIGVERRFDIKINSDSIIYIDDYAHHPKELESAILSIKGMYPNKRITGIFQPHLYSRTKDFYKEFAESLNLLDRTILLEIYPAREMPIEGISSQIIADNMESGRTTTITKNQLLNYIENIDTEVLVTFGAGDIDRFVKPITDILRRRYNV